MSIITNYIHTVGWFILIPIGVIPLSIIIALKAKSDFDFEHWKDMDRRKLHNILLILICLLSWIYAIFIPYYEIKDGGHQNIFEKKVTMDDISKKSESYVIYIDGIQVDNDKIDITNYDIKAITINDDKKEIYIASRSKG